MLSDDALKAFRRNGFVACATGFTGAEVRVLRELAEAEFDRDSAARVLEKDGRTVRGVHGSQRVNADFARLVRDPRLLGPATAVLGGPAYVHQFKINAKKAMRGDVWPWHQDFIFWNRADGMRDARMVNVAVLLDEATDVNGPLLVIPGTHLLGTLEPAARERPRTWESHLSADLEYAFDAPKIAELTADREIVPIKGEAGAVFLFDPQLVHGSGTNMAPHDRRIVLVTYNHVDNVPDAVEHPRPEFLAARDFAPLEPLEPGFVHGDRVE
ncbi:phytanoyl-CoA dioxygenase family protein [Actinosynnema sp. CS-041913]|uniref:phytanoyl-CoA dioxygenase family protein n=1 Tax=Actinosynnema sp. CS-041913 TaxID=3239917 RepID=UPI003D8F36D1